MGPVCWVTGTSTLWRGRMGVGSEISPTGPTAAPLRTPDVKTGQQHPPVAARAIAGLLATGVALAVGHAIAGALDSRSSPFLAVADTVVAVRTWDRETDAQRTFPLSECGFRPGGSRFQEVLGDGSWRFEILDVAFLLKQGDLTAPVQDVALAAAVGIQRGQRVPLADVRDAVQRLR